jgi:hypothetical protein
MANNEHPGLVPLMNLADKPLDLNTDRDFGVWHYYAHDRTLVTTAGGYEYWIELEKIDTNAKMQDWIFHIDNKTWATDAVVANLVRAFNKLFDPQKNLCSYGKDKLLPAGFLRRKARK